MLVHNFVGSSFNDNIVMSGSSSVAFCHGFIVSATHSTAMGSVNQDLMILSWLRDIPSQGISPGWVWTYSLKTWSGNSAKVSVLSFCHVYANFRTLNIMFSHKQTNQRRLSKVKR